jgi:hypothetical protein
MSTLLVLPKKNIGLIVSTNMAAMRPVVFVPQHTAVRTRPPPCRLPSTRSQTREQRGHGQDAPIGEPNG